MAEVECVTLDGHTRAFPSDRLILRPAAYALIVHEGKLLVLKMRQTGKYHLPGGGVHVGEWMEEALKREAQEETGIEIEVVRLARFEEVFFYYDPSDRAYHGLHFYFFCRPRTLSLVPDDQVDDESAGEPRWVEIRGLRPEEFQYHGELVLKLCQEAAG